MTKRKTKAAGGNDNPEGRARVEREKVGSRALDAFGRGEFDEVERIADELGPGHLRLFVDRDNRLATFRVHPSGDAEERLPTGDAPLQICVPFSMLRGATGVGDAELLVQLKALDRRLRDTDDEGAEKREERKRRQLAGTAFGLDALAKFAGSPGAIRDLEAFNGCGGCRWRRDVPAKRRGKGYERARKTLAAMVACGLMASPRRGQFKLGPCGRKPPVRRGLASAGE